MKQASAVIFWVQNYTFTETRPIAYNPAAIAGTYSLAL